MNHTSLNDTEALFLKENYKKLTVLKIAEFFDKKVCNVYSEIYRFKINKNGLENYLENREKVKHVKSKYNNYYNKEDEKFLVENKYKMSASELSEKLGRTKSSILNKKHRSIEKYENMDEYIIIDQFAKEVNLSLKYVQRKVYTKKIKNSKKYFNEIYIHKSELEGYNKRKNLK